MSDNAQRLNELIVEAYHNVLRLEEYTLKKSGRLNLTINEMHLIERVGKAKEEGLTVSELAMRLNVTRPSVTVAVNKLERKGYLVKTPGLTDGRVVRVNLTRNGQKVYHYHMYYHRNMIKRISENFSDGQMELLIQTMGRLNQFFIESMGK